MVASRPTKTNPQEYLKIVKKKLQNKRDVYIRFLEVMTAFTARRMDSYIVRSVVRELFKEDKELILGFNPFLPKELRIKLDGEQTTPIMSDEYWKALDFVKKVKDDVRIYKSFVNIMDMFMKEKKSTDEICHEVTILFRDHHDLRVEFYHFLPQNLPRKRE
ncbi:PREDICTED: paired amphipathic helix protein Sin3-like 4 [Camelina sativa]|uniref:Paired amphipathic helix protein Sin3-like 4 n=1 Tax=Camelina sativa TaxID=90675 RepID=A0ABM1QMW2_CAMSA|nr:PREDICTED: paired amphipathic helix protein Sin3-like 4 [Camelina sativa]